MTRPRLAALAPLAAALTLVASGCGSAGNDNSPGSPTSGATTSETHTETTTSETHTETTTSETDTKTTEG